MFNRNPPVTVSRSDFNTFMKPDPVPSNDAVKLSNKFIYRSPNRVLELENMKIFSAENGLGRGAK